MDTPSVIGALRPGSEAFLDTTKIVASFDIREGMSIADFGCGSGHFSILLAKKTGPQGKVYALDIQEPPLETVRGKAKAEGLENLETIRGNLEVIGGSSLRDASQDLVLVANILFQSSKKSDILKEVRRVLRDGGQIAVIEWKKGVAGGPPENLRTDQETLKSIILAEGFNLERNIDAGAFHFGMIFRK